MNSDVIASIISFVPLKYLKSVLISNSKLPDISLSQYPFGTHYESYMKNKQKVPTIYKIFNQKAFKLLKNPNISQHNLLVNAIHNGMTELVKVMLKNKQIDISKQYCFDSSYEHKKFQYFRPLSHALSEDKPEIVKVLLKDDRVDPNSVELYWHPSIHAINKGNINSLKVLMKDKRVNFISEGIFYKKELDLVMIMAIRSRYYSIIKVLVNDDRIKINKCISDFVVNSLICWISRIDILNRPDNGVENDLKILSLLIEQPGFDFTHKDRIIATLNKFKRIDILQKLTSILKKVKHTM